MEVFDRLCRLPGFEITIVYGREKPGTLPRSVVEGVPFQSRLIETRYWDVGRHEIAAQPAVLRSLLRRDFDIYICEFDLKIVTNLLTALLSHRYGARFIWWGHGFSKSETPLKTALRCRFIHWADAVLLYNATAKHRYAEIGLSPGKMFVAYNSLDTDKLTALRARVTEAEVESLRRQLNLPGRRVAIYVGRLLTEKKVDLLLRAFAQAREREPELSLLIVGDGPERLQLERLARELNVAPAVRFCGSITDQREVVRYFCCADVCVSPGFVGLMIINSFAYRVPIILPDHDPHSPEIEAFQEGVNGLAFPSDDATALAERLIRISRDADLRQRLGAGAQQTIAERFNIHRMIQGFADALAYVSREPLGGPPGPGQRV
jgi:glycosyltransferase involved in cell wall biosynthesis